MSSQPEFRHMPIPVEARFWTARAFGLWRRGCASLRNRGLQASWQRLKLQFRRSAIATHALYSPAPDPFAPFNLPTSDAPLASIVIPVHGAFAHTLACLRAITAHPPAAAFEVIVVDDASPDDSLVRLSQIEGLRLHSRSTNGGFIAACNDGAAMARGEYVIFLNNDTVPQPGWLDTLLRSFDEHADVGLVGAKLVYPDGRLQEAGGVVFADGSAWNYGRNEDPADCRFDYVRDVDYVSGAAIAIPRALFQQLGPPTMKTPTSRSRCAQQDCVCFSSRAPLWSMTKAPPPAPIRPVAQRPRRSAIYMCSPPNGAMHWPRTCH
jgi:hypothetical protein